MCGEEGGCPLFCLLEAQGGKNSLVNLTVQSEGLEMSVSLVAKYSLTDYLVRSADHIHLNENEI